MKNVNKLFSITAVALAVSGCSSAPKPPKPTGEMIAVNKTIPLEIASSLKPIQPKAPVVKKPEVSSGVVVGGINNDEFPDLAAIETSGTKNAKPTASKCFACESSKSSLSAQAVKPAVSVPAKPVVTAAPKPVVIAPINYQVNDGETDLQAIARWSKKENLDVLLNTSDAITERLNKREKQTLTTSFQASLSQLSGVYAKENLSLKFWFNIDRSNKKLIIHDIGDRLDVHLFPVKRGSLKENAIRLAHDLGWKADNASWLASTPVYNVIADYNLVASGDIVRSYENLFKDYNVQAQLDQSTNTVYFTTLTK